MSTLIYAYTYIHNRRGVGEGAPGPGNVSAPTAASQRARLALTAVRPAGARRSRDQSRRCTKGGGRSNRRGVGEKAPGPGNMSTPTATSERARLALTAVRPAGAGRSRDQNRRKFRDCSAEWPEVLC